MMTARVFHADLWGKSEHKYDWPAINEVMPVNGDDRVERGYPKDVPAGAGGVKAGMAKLEDDRDHGRVYINKGQYFEGVEPAVWEFQIGGYQVCEKWLKDRRGRTLDYDDLTHYRKIIESL